MLNNSISANALDNRAGIATVLWALKELENLKFYADIYAVATTQEEVGLRGAITSSFEIYPDIGIAIDVCHGNMKDVPEPDSYILGNGPTLALGPNIHPRLFNRLKNLAEEYKIPYQIDVEPSNTVYRCLGNTDNKGRNTNRPYFNTSSLYAYNSRNNSY